MHRQNCNVLYVELSPIHFSDFTPSRVTRPSSNRYLQEHSTLDQLYETVRTHRSPAQESYFLVHVTEAERRLQGRYVQVEFAQTYPGCTSGEERSRDCVPAGREKSISDPTANGTVHPLCVRSRTERRRTAFRRRNKSNASSVSSAECAFVADVVEGMDVEPSVVMYHGPFGGTNTLLTCNGVQAGAAQQHLQHFSPHAPATSRAITFADGRERSVSHTSSCVSQDRTPPFKEGGPVEIDDGRRNSEDQSRVALTPPSRERQAMSQLWGWKEEEEEEEYRTLCDDIHQLPDLPQTRPVVASHRLHHPLSRLPACPFSSSHSGSPPALTEPHPGFGHHGNKPVPPPPRTKSQDSLYSSIHDNKTAEDNKPISPSAVHRPRSVSFMNCKAGVDLGQFPAEYLGSKQMDCYIECVDMVAKSVINSKPIEVAVYVTSEKLRLAPPKNPFVLFKSFAIKDILSVQKCSKNKRILGIVVWKGRAMPLCHVLRCPTHLVSSALYDSILDQTQNVDDVSLSKICPPRRLSEVSNSSSNSSTNGDCALSPIELLHKLPAIHIGSTKVMRMHTVNDVIQRVLQESRPSGAREVCVWLSLAQVRLVDMSDEHEMIYESHETSRIRAIGVYSIDKRFIGYIIKEEGKPLMGHVLRCNSAGLMVSLMSFLRQACQITFSHQGGSLYDELSADDSEDYDAPEDSTPSHGIIHRLRSITNVHKPVSPTASQASFVAHTSLYHSPSHSDPSLKKQNSVHSHPTAAITSPLEFSEEDFARFSVTYIGSATLELPFSSRSIVQAQKVFEEGGMAAGRAAVPKNVIQMHVSSLGINLIDKKHRLFVNRNYPRKQLAGFLRHPENEKVFAFASKRQGYPTGIKCHLFRQVQEPTQHILDTLQYWLEMEPTT